MCVLDMADVLMGRTQPPLCAAGSRKPSLDENGVVWPVMFIYPENMQNTDAVEAFHEHHMLSDHLDAMYGELTEIGRKFPNFVMSLPSSSSCSSNLLVCVPRAPLQRIRQQGVVLSASFVMRRRASQCLRPGVQARRRR